MRSIDSDAGTFDHRNQMVPAPAGSEFVVVGLSQHVCSFFHGSARFGKSSFINGKLMTTGVDRFPKPLHTKIGELFGNSFESFPDVIELSRHYDLRYVRLFGQLDDSWQQ